MALTTKNAGALSPGNIPEVTMAATVRVIVTRAFYYNGQLQPVGTVLEMNPIDAGTAIYTRKANRIVETVVEIPKTIEPMMPVEEKKTTAKDVKKK